MLNQGIGLSGDGQECFMITRCIDFVLDLLDARLQYVGVNIFGAAPNAAFRVKVHARAAVREARF